MTIANDNTAVMATTGHADDVTEFVVHFNPRIFEHAKRRAANILLAHSFNDLPPEGYIAGGEVVGIDVVTDAAGGVDIGRFAGKGPAA